METAINQGTVRGVLVGSTTYTGKSGKMQRLDIKLPSPSPLDHPTTVSIHTERSHANQLNKEIEISFRAQTFLKHGKGKGSNDIYDTTRLYEV